MKLFVLFVLKFVPVKSTTTTLEPELEEGEPWKSFRTGHFEDQEWDLILTADEDVEFMLSKEISHLRITEGCTLRDSFEEDEYHCYDHFFINATANFDVGWLLEQYGNVIATRVLVVWTSGDSLHLPEGVFLQANDMVIEGYGPKEFSSSSGSSLFVRGNAIVIANDGLSMKMKGHLTIKDTMSVDMRKECPVGDPCQNVELYAKRGVVKYLDVLVDDQSRQIGLSGDWFTARSFLAVRSPQWSMGLRREKSLHLFRRPPPSLTMSPLLCRVLQSHGTNRHRLCQ